MQEAVFFGVADLFNLEVDLLFFDITSTYFEIEDEDEEGDSIRRRPCAASATPRTAAQTAPR